MRQAKGGLGPRQQPLRPVRPPTAPEAHPPARGEPRACEARATWMPKASPAVAQLRLKALLVPDPGPSIAPHPLSLQAAHALGFRRDQPRGSRRERHHRCWARDNGHGAAVQQRLAGPGATGTAQQYYITGTPLDGLRLGVVIPAMHRHVEQLRGNAKYVPRPVCDPERKFGPHVEQLLLFN